MNNFYKIILISGVLASAVLGMESKKEVPIFDGHRIRAAYEKKSTFSTDEWVVAAGQAQKWAQDLSLSKFPCYKAAELFYVQKIKEESADLLHSLEKKNAQFIFHGLNKLSHLEDALRVLVADAGYAKEDLTDEDVKEVKRAVVSEEKVHVNRTIPPDADRSFEAIVITRTRLNDSDTIVDIGASELDVAAVLSFSGIPKFVHETEKTKDSGFTIGSDSGVSFNSGKTTKIVHNVDEFKKMYSLTADTFYKEFNFRIKFNKDDSYLFLQDLTMLGETADFKSICHGPKNESDLKLFKHIVEDDATKLPSKQDLAFKFSSGKESIFAVQIRLTEMKSRFIRKDKEVSEWIVNFVKGKDGDAVTNLMNGVLLKNKK
jgi:hypothetical protein